MSNILRASIVFAALCALYLFLAGSVSTVEVIAMAFCSLVGVALSLGMRRVAREELVLRPPPRAILRPFVALLPEVLSVGRALVEVSWRGAGRHQGDFQHQPYRIGDDASREAGRRAIGLIGMSLAPRTFVVRAEPARQTVLLHGFPPKPVSPDRDWPA